VVNWSWGPFRSPSRTHTQSPTTWSHKSAQSRQNRPFSTQTQPTNDVKTEEQKSGPEPVSEETKKPSGEETSQQQQQQQQVTSESEAKQQLSSESDVKQQLNSESEAKQQDSGEAKSDSTTTNENQAVVEGSDWPPVGDWPAIFFVLCGAFVVIFLYTFFAVRGTQLLSRPTPLPPLF